MVRGRRLEHKPLRPAVLSRPGDEFLFVGRVRFERRKLAKEAHCIASRSDLQAVGRRPAVPAVQEDTASGPRVRNYHVVFAPLSRPRQLAIDGFSLGKSSLPKATRAITSGWLRANPGLAGARVSADSEPADSAAAEPVSGARRIRARIAGPSAGNA